MRPEDGQSGTIVPPNKGVGNRRFAVRVQTDYALLGVRPVVMAFVSESSQSCW